jgi:hypothetical protein
VEGIPEVLTTANESSHWVIQFEGTTGICWITQTTPGAAFDVTFRLVLAQRFTCAEDARHECLRLGLSGAWQIREYRNLEGAA